MADDKIPTQGSDELAEGMKKLGAAQRVDDDAVEIAADDQGASALAQKLDKLDEDGSPQR